MKTEEHKKPSAEDLLEAEANRRTEAAQANTTIETKRRHKEVARVCRNIAAQVRATYNPKGN